MMRKHSSIFPVDVRNEWAEKYELEIDDFVDVSIRYTLMH